MPWIAQDNMDRADAATLGGNWVLVQGIGNHLGIFSNQADLTTASARNGDGYSGFNWSPDQYAQATVQTLPDATGLVAVVVRAEIVTGAVRTYYAAGMDQGDFADQQTRIWKEVANVQTGLATSGSVDISVGSTVRLEVKGATLTCFVNGVQRVQVNDTAIGAGAPGLIAVHNAIDVALFDNFEAGDFAQPLQPPNLAPVGGYSVA